LPEPDPAPRRILAAVDGSEPSLAALRHAAALARMHHARLSVVAVAPMHPTVTQSMAAMSGWAPEPPEQWMGQELRKAVDTLPPDQPVTAYLKLGTAVHEIVALASDGEHDLVVMGSRGGHPLTSVSRRVVRRSPVPVVVVGEPPAKPRLRRRRRPLARAASAVLPRTASPPRRRAAA
jgi:nucleotide-binding universal stress UspA family protein